MSETIGVAIIGALAIVMAPILLALLNRALDQRDKARAKAIEIAEEKDSRITELERENGELRTTILILRQSPNHRIDELERTLGAILRQRQEGSP